MAKTNKEILDEMNLKSAREHEEWIRRVVQHENKWMLLRVLIGIVNAIFFVCVVALLTVVLIIVSVEAFKVTGTYWLFTGMLIIGLLGLVKLMLSGFGSKFQLINYDAKTPLFIDKIDKKEVKDE